MTHNLDAFFAEDGFLSKEVRDYQLRDVQQQMSEAVQDGLAVLSSKTVIEAGTGTGKSFAYLLPALLSDKKTVVSTGTKTLQDQLFYSDLPLVNRVIERATGQKKKIALLKGRNNYLCLLRFETFKQRPLFLFQEDSKYFDSIVEWVFATETGDRSEIPDLPDQYSSWDSIDAKGETCIGQKCAHYEECFVTRAKRNALKADLVVINHHLLCADARIRLEGVPQQQSDDGEESLAFVVPECEALVIDEAHVLPGVASSYFGVEVALSRVGRLGRDLEAVILLAPQSYQSLLRSSALALVAQTENMNLALKSLMGDKDQVRLEKETASPVLEPIAQEMTGSLSRLASVTEDCLENLKGKDAIEAEYMGLNRRAEQLAEEIQFLVHKALPDVRFVTYCELTQHGLILSSTPIDIASALQKTLFSDQRSTVLTSATLSSGRDLSAFKSRVGLFAERNHEDESGQLIKEKTDIREHRFESPFPYKEQAGLYVPAHIPEPKDGEYVDIMRDEISFLVEQSDGGALLLFTSYRAMNLFFEELGQDFIDIGLEVQKQGDRPKKELLEWMRLKPNTVLFATQSFWEGIDVRGSNLRLLIIDRLPFKPPTDPVFEARSEYVKNKGMNPFRTLALPEASISLQQGVGRLIRSEKDCGVVAILDSRLRNKSYGKVLMNSLPPMMRLGSQKTVKQFWEKRVFPLIDL